MKTHPQVNPTELHTAIKLRIDARAEWFYIARQLDGATPQPVQKMCKRRPKTGKVNGQWGVYSQNIS